MDGEHVHSMHSDTDFTFLNLLAIKSLLSVSHLKVSTATVAY